MKKVKLPRKRKKAFKKHYGKGDYMMAVLLAEILVEEGRMYADRFYEVTHKKRGDKRFSPFNNGYVVVKRW